MRTKNLSVRWHPHYNKLHLKEYLKCDSFSIGTKLAEKIYNRIFDIIKNIKVQFIVTEISKNLIPKIHLTYYVPLCHEFNF